MSWIHIAIVLGYLIVLVAILAFFRGAALVSRDLHDRRTEDEPERASDATRHAA